MEKMEQLFPSFFQPQLKKKELTAEDTVIVLDTNFLLDIYRLNPSLADKYIASMRRINDRLFIPYFVALEFEFNKSKIIRQKSQFITDQKQKLLKAIDEVEPKIDELKRDSSFPSLQKFTLNKHELEQLLNKDINRFIESSRMHALHNKVAGVIDHKISNKPTQEFIEETQKKGEERYKQQVPPGYNDAQIKEDELRKYDGLEYKRKYGDLLIWETILDELKNRDGRVNRLVFVSNDGTSEKKDDLIFTTSGQRVGPKIEFIEEMRIETNVKFYILKNSTFVSMLEEISETDKREINQQLNHFNDFGETNKSDIENEYDRFTKKDEDRFIRNRVFNGDNISYSNSLREDSLNNVSVNENKNLHTDKENPDELHWEMPINHHLLDTDPDNDEILRRIEKLQHRLKRNEEFMFQAKSMGDQQRYLSYRDEYDIVRHQLIRLRRRLD